MPVGIDHPKVAQLRQLVDHSAEPIAEILPASADLRVGLIFKQRFHETLADLERVEYLARMFMHDVDGATSRPCASLNCAVVSKRKAAIPKTIRGKHQRCRHKNAQRLSECPASRVNQTDASGVLTGGSNDLDRMGFPSVVTVEGSRDVDIREYSCKIALKNQLPSNGQVWAWNPFRH